VDSHPDHCGQRRGPVRHRCDASFDGLSHQSVAENEGAGGESVRTGQRSPLFEQVESLDQLDPNIKQTYDGPPSGVGAIYAWDGDKNVGSGRQTIVESLPHELVRMRAGVLSTFRRNQPG